MDSGAFLTVTTNIFEEIQLVIVGNYFLAF